MFPNIRKYLQGESEAVTKTKIPQIAAKKETLKKLEKEINKGNVMITKINDVQSYDADVIGTYSQSSGTVSYDSIKSMNNESLEKAKNNSKYVGLFRKSFIDPYR